jgi:hypothetical protein
MNDQSAEGMNAECNSAIRQIENLRYPERISLEMALKVVDTVGGDRRTEELIMQYLRERHSAPTVLDIPPKVAQAILDRPKAFVRAAREWCLPDVPF